MSGQATDDQHASLEAIFGMLKGDDLSAWTLDYHSFLEGKPAKLACRIGGLPAAISKAISEIKVDGGGALGCVQVLRGLLAEANESTLCIDADTEIDHDGHHRLFELSQHVPTDAPGIPEESGLRIRPGEKGRTRLVFQSTEPMDRVCLHLLLTIDSVDHGEPPFELRLLNNNLPEEKILSFRYASLGIAGRFPLPMHLIGTTRLYTIVLDGCKFFLYIDGLPVWSGRPITGGAKTGFNLDLIGIPGSGGNVVVHWIRFSALKEPFSGLYSTEPELIQKLVMAALSAGDSTLLRVLLFGQNKIDSLVPSESAAAALASIVARERAFPEGLISSVNEIFGGALALPAAPFPLLEVDEVSVRFAINPAETSPLRMLLGGGGKQLFDALSNVSFRAFPGDIIGIIGKNGAGKTTLLRAIQGSIPITNGRIRVRGSILLLRPGAGMSGELTGRQNILRSALYMGLMPIEVREKMNEIIEFSELEAHIDRPFRYYSDGMKARLVFALATSVSPDILMLDELLGAGDRSFQEKALERLDSFLSRAKVVLVVQHALDFVLRRCTKCLYLKGGTPVYFGDPKIAAELYLNE